MTNNDELQDFVTESKELIGDAERALLAMEGGEPFGQHYDAIFRAFHNIKGVSGMLGMLNIQSHVHQLESALMSLQGVASLPKAYVDFFLRGCDATVKLMNGEKVDFDYGDGPLAASEPPEPGLSISKPREAVETSEKGPGAPSAFKSLEHEGRQSPSGDAESPPAAVFSAEFANVPQAPAKGGAWAKVEALLQQALPDEYPQPIQTRSSDAQEFLNESDEAATRVCNMLMGIERGGASDVAVTDSVYRDVHSIKGGAQLFNFAPLAELAHTLESGLEVIRARGTPIGKGEVDPVLRVMGTIVKWIAQLRSDTMTGAGVNPDGRQSLSSPSPALLRTDGMAGGTTEAPKQDTKHDVGETSTVRVPVALLDKLMASMGEMVLVRNQVLQFASKSDDFEFLRLSQRLDIVTSEIQGEVMKTRMQPIANVLSKFQRIVRDLSKSLNKRIDLHLIGAETELDKTLLESVRDPLMHIVRNSCDHGIETPEARKAAGKLEVGRVTIRSYQEGGQVVIEISDDGRGLDREKLIRKAVEKGIYPPERAATLSDREVFAIIFAPGFSTAAQVTNVSGRGVGMDVVKSNIERIGGTVELESKAGIGIALRLKIPLTLAILPAMIVRLGQARYAIPQLKVVELLRVEPGNSGTNRINILEGKPIYRTRGRLLPLLALREVLAGSNDAGQDMLSQAANIVVVKAEKQMFGLIVDEVQDKADIVVKPLSSFLKAVTAYNGATVLGDGSIALILDINGIAARHGLGLNDGRPVDEEPRLVETDVQELLLFRLNGRKERHAIALNLVHRLEEFNVKEVESSGDQRVVRYRGGLLPLCSLRKELGITDKASELDQVEGTLQVIVVKKSARLYGFWVDDILDVLQTDASMDDGPSDRPSILGNIVHPEGVVVVVDILRVVADVVKSLVPPVQAEAQAAGYPASGQRVLFAEDTTFFRKHVKSVLEKAGYTVDTAVNGLEALERIQSEPPGTYALVLSDIEMPVMNGLEFIKRLRANDSFKGLPSIALTTKFTPEYVAEGKAAGFTEYLEKMNAEVLLGTMSRLTGIALKPHGAHS